MDREVDRKTNGQRDRGGQIKVGRWKDRQRSRQTDLSDKQKDRQRNKRTEKKTDRQTGTGV